MLETKEILDAIQKATETIATPNCAAWLSAVASVGAVFAAIIIAVKQREISMKQNEIAEKQASIAEQQNRIELFEKRYELYQLAVKCMNVAFFLESYRYHNANEFYKYVFLYFNEIVMENQNVGKDRVTYAMNDIANRLHQSEFLFSSEVSNHIRLLAECFRSFVLLEDIFQSNEDFQKTKQQYCKTASMLKSNQILAKMKSELQPILVR